MSARRSWGTVTKKGRRFYVEYTGPDHRRHTPGRSFPTRTAADGWLAAERRLIDLDTWTPPRHRTQTQETPTLGDWLGTWLDLLERRPQPLRESTRQNYARTIRNRITAPVVPGANDPRITRLAGLRLAQITRKDVYQWWDGIQAAYPQTQPTNRAAYIRLRSALSAAVKRELIASNPADIDGAGRKPPSKEKRLPTDAEITAAIRALPARYRLMGALTLHEGLRIGEALGLTAEDITITWRDVPYLPAVSIKVRRNLQRITPAGKASRMVVFPPKTKAGAREVTMLTADVPVLIEHLTRFPARGVVLEAEGGKAVTLCVVTTTATGRVLLDTAFRSVLERACGRAGIGVRLTPHLGRNWLITRLAEQGAHPKEIGAILGQEDLGTILGVYMKARSGRAVDLMGRVSGSLEG